MVGFAGSSFDVWQNCLVASAPGCKSDNPEDTSERDMNYDIPATRRGRA